MSKEKIKNESTADSRTNSKGEACSPNVEASSVSILTPEEWRRILASYDPESGFREWTGASYNIAYGCPHNCRYCVQRQLAVRHGDLPSRDAWPNEQLKKVRPKIRKFEGGVMFPSAHDITPPILIASITAIKDLLALENKVLIVSKPHLNCIKPICNELRGSEDKVLFRFTIGTLDKKLAAFWEPGAPDPLERLACLQYAKSQGYQTSVSMEPMLAGVEETIRTFRRLLPFVTETIWVGKLNRKAVFGQELGVRIASWYIRELQSDHAILELVSRLSREPKVRWKDSIREVIRRHLSGQPTLSATSAQINSPDDVGL
jgi:DNA repair photolyase